MRKVLLAALMAAMMSVTAGARADFQDGNSLYAQCTSALKYDDAYCLGYIAGITDVMSHDPVAGRTACEPEHATAGQVQDIVRLYLTKHPEQRHYAAESLVAHALAAAFPCR
jgi:hypothetical protein